MRIDGRSRRTGRLAVWAAAALGAAAACGSAAADIIREGTGPRRDALNEMELKPFDTSLWSSLTNWTNGEPVTPASTDGKVVVVYTFSSFLPQSLRPLVALDRLEKRYADQGVMVVGVHHPERWDDAERQVSRRRAGFVFAHDSEGRFREALRVDQDPDIYVIDRAGQLRYADIETGSIDDALAELVEETAVTAGSVLERRADAARDAAREARRSGALRSGIDLASLPEIPFTPPTPEEYEAIDWPDFLEYVPFDQLSSGRGREREDDSPRPIALPAEGNYQPGPPPSGDGRLTLIYFWTPMQGMAARASFFDRMQQLQREHPRDLRVVGVAIAFEGDSRSRRGEEQEEREREIKEARERFNTFFDRKPLNHTLLEELESAAVYTSVITGSGRRGSRNQDRWLPYMALLSSDGQLRWHGYASGRDNERFRDVFSRFLREDPGVIARRAADEAYITAQLQQRLGNDDN